MNESSDDASSALGIYQQFRGLVASGQLGAGERLPTVRQSASDLGVAPGTVAKAYKMLERDGFVETRVGSGTRVSASAAVLPGAVVEAIRELVTRGKASSASAEDVLTAVRAMWARR
ncbi:GntR family transcriptional regulator [Microbacteriaceae bacterium SG_E_30_P1]|uniref:GntR family transcriptional regulator n=1 Tax=Antiquaquibacter oligotrophicus TaxID=2880260 RepID=A0ABT6KLM5_9MICO|nr:GntR family transcriptional regulator [Antiquaquibacter oligotrophicus]MDH6180032.1 GntR family transcriptional regulator [Antiquaquibacter oligotrophicus]UDF14214.1 GntR family transcriptional regulator [Antiquaquibacter oligotrophicus]